MKISTNKMFIAGILVAATTSTTLGMLAVAVSEVPLDIQIAERTKIAQAYSTSVLSAEDEVISAEIQDESEDNESASSEELAQSDDKANTEHQDTLVKTEIESPPQQKPVEIASTPAQQQPASTPQTQQPATSTTNDGVNISFSFINNLRAAAGKQALILDASANDWATTHAQTLANSCTLYHQNIRGFLGRSFSVGTVSRAGENIAYNSTIQGALNWLRNSSVHYGNMTGDYTHIGIGVVQSTASGCAGKYYTVQVYIR